MHLCGPPAEPQHEHFSLPAQFAYGACELCFNKLRFWLRRGPISPILGTYLMNRHIPWYAKVRDAACMCCSAWLSQVIRVTGAHKTRKGPPAVHGAQSMLCTHGELQDVAVSLALCRV